MRLLLVEDDAMVGAAVRKGLVGAGFAVDWVTDGRAADLSLATSVYDLVVLDLGLPRKDGMAVLDTLRKRGDRRMRLFTFVQDQQKTSKSVMFVQQCPFHAGFRSRGWWHEQWQNCGSPAVRLG